MNKKLLQAIQDGREDIFYNSRTWRNKRLEILERDNKECQMCKSEGRVTIGTNINPLTVHHIKHLKKYPTLGLTSSNLVTICREHHELEHPEKLMRQGYEKKKLINEEKW